MVAAVHYFGDDANTESLRQHLGDGIHTELRRWWPFDEGADGLIARTNPLTGRLAVVSTALGPPELIRDPDHPALLSPDRSGMFLRRNLESRPGGRGAVIDPNRSPVLFWEPSAVSEDTLEYGSIGSQADSMRAISGDYERWVNRTMNWVRRRGTRVWGLEGASVRPDLRIDVPHVSALYALPGALARLEAGATGR